MKTSVFFLLLTLGSFSFAQTLDSVDYTFESSQFRGYYAKPKKITSKTVTVLIVHEWWGLNDYPKQRAMQLAKEGYIAFCIDMYGVGKISDNPKGAMELSSPFYSDPQMAYNHFMAGYNAVINIEGVNANHIAAIGYCFGGAMVLNAAKFGAPVDAVVSFHGGLAGIPVDKEKLKAAVLVCHGADDQFVPQADIDTLQQQMDAAKANYHFISYPHATHAFTNSHSTEVGKKFSIPIAYNKEADEKSWADFKLFLKKHVR